ncbi:MAG: DUF4011 domain-containing protein, partial [Anaerolineales bacterium]|nr:DUF4011 domain-containing protein [Anaerolineales bacterium]
YRPLKSRGVQVVDERPRDLYTLLVQDGLKMYFLEQGDPAPPPADLAQPSLSPREKQFTDNKLQTPYSTSDLQKRLLNTYYTARSYIEEQGVNILYLALGMLRWTETAQSAKVRRAPLVLIPVEIDRTNVNSRFYIRYTGLDISTNLSLAAKLRLDYALQLPELPPDEALDIDAYFTAVRTSILDHPHWEVDHTAVSLAFFSFSKFFIYNDLDPTHWPKHHPILESLLHPDGFIEPPPAVGDDDLVDDYVNLDQSHQVISADSTQLAALLDVRGGRNLVIQGPPGTGKSQTITNILADALGRGQKVLFVSEKMAALDVVKRRLDALGLGDAALELHSHKTTKRDLLDELGRVLSLGQPHDDGAFPDLPQLDKLTKRLNDYSTALNSPLGQSGLTPYDIYGYLIQLQNEFTAFPVPDLAALAAPLPPNWSPTPDHRTVLADLQSLLGRLGVPQAHPFWGSACPETRPGDEQKIRTQSTTAVSTLQTLRHASHTLAQELTLTPPTTLAQAQTLSHTAQRLLSAPNLHSIRIDHPAWRENAFQLRPIFEAGIEISTLTQKYDVWLIPEAWQQDVLDVRQALKRHGQKLWRALIGDFRDAQNKLLGLCRTALPPDVPTQLRLVDAILHVQHLRPQIAQLEPTLHELFGQRWRGIEQSDWFDLAEAGNWLLRLYEQLDRLDPQLIPYLAQNFTYERRQNLRQLATAHDDALRDYQTQLHDQLLPLLHLPQADFPATFNEQETRLTRWAREAGRFGEWVAYVQWQQTIRAETQNTAVFPFLTLADQWPHASTHLLHLFDIHWYNSLLTTATAEQYALWQFDSDQQQAAITQFRQLDDTFLQRNRHKLAHQHWQYLPRHSGGGRMGLLLHEIGKKRQHLPIRQLMHETGDIIQRLKPIFMMSPLSIAMFLPPNDIQFDLVVFDEASQVRPVDAFGALLRAKQAVVVGDSRQLPPTTFFERALGEAQNTPTDDSTSDHWQEGAEEFVEPEETALLGSITADNESILDLFVRQNAPQRLLRWHYRSRHESLIAISNDEFYEGQLRLFPSPHPRRAGLGLHLRHLPDTVYDRGKSRTNPAEATAVARAIMTHARDFPHLTLGVAAFSSAQRQAIEEALEKARLAESRYESFFQSHPVEPFFIKNLENVQGDERDVILISVGYGRDQEGKVWLNFGPLNQLGGERRLNVLITRARRQCVVFSNITAVDLDLRHTDSAGLHALRAYLAYAANPADGPEIMDSEARRTRPLPFEDELARILRQAGYEVARRVGQHGVVVDLAVQGTAGNGYQLGIECD